jgi:hypothetical protein
MPGTRTAPQVDLVPSVITFKTVSLRWTDYTSDVRTDTYQLAATATSAQIENLADALQAASNASLYEIKISEHYSSVPDNDNALEEVWENVTDNLVIQAKKPTNESIRVFVPSPVNSMFIETTDAIDPTSVVLGAVLTAFDAVIDIDYEYVGARFTSRRQINQQVKF